MRKKDEKKKNSIIEGSNNTMVVRIQWDTISKLPFQANKSIQNSETERILSKRGSSPLLPGREVHVGNCGVVAAFLECVTVNENHN